MSTTLTAYRVPPQQEMKAAAELRQAGNKAYVPRKRLRRPSPFTGKFWPVAPGYVFSDDKVRLTWARHVKSKVGCCDKANVANLVERRTKPQPTRLFSIGDKVLLADGPFDGLMGTVIAECGAGYMVKLSARAFEVIVPMAQHALRRYVDPG